MISDAEVSVTTDHIAAFEEAYSACRPRTLAADHMELRVHASLAKPYSLWCLELNRLITRFSRPQLDAATSRLTTLAARPGRLHHPTRS